ncbi:TPA: glycerol phosphate lipoteichoic acid synthase, partial [Staphylococcus aureus]|nr:glycerol phosphate lipoteichoic acid synthase [Staphylococcus aureus]HCD5601976.1 glycerol phosphate lipoteichoic acid synthase [Staphylococcus aureus]
IYSNKNNELITTQPADFEKNKKQVEKDLEMSDNVLNGDLFRFYKNPDFKKVNPSKYKYETGPKANSKK